MWNAFVQRRNGGGYDERASALQVIELSDDDCKLLVAAGLKVQKGASPRDLYCFQYLPAYYDGTPLQVLRLLEEAKSAGQKARRAEAATASSRPESAKRQRRSLTSTTRMQVVEEAVADDDGVTAEYDGDVGELPELIKITPSATSKLPPSPVKGGGGGAAMYSRIASPVKPSLTTPPTKGGSAATPVARRSHRSSMKIDVVSVQEEASSTSSTTSSSTRKRKSESGSPSTSTSPLAALFSPKSIRTPSPGLKTRRSSVLQQFDTPEQPTNSGTPQTEPAPPKRFSTTKTTTKKTHYTVTTTTSSDVDADADDDDLSDGLVDDAPDDDERACCDVKSVMEPLLDALHRTSSRVQSAWEEYSMVTPTKATTKTK